MESEDLLAMFLWGLRCCAELEAPGRKQNVSVEGANGVAEDCATELGRWILDPGDLLG